ncbi:hypothetical protein [Enterobacter asburiae]|nr:hypothetical protein [Enterobacter asburiae]
MNDKSMFKNCDKRIDFIQKEVDAMKQNKTSPLLTCFFIAPWILI